MPPPLPRPGSVIPPEPIRQEIVAMVQSVLATRATPATAQPYLSYLSHGTLPKDEVEARQIQRRSKSFTIINQELYCRSVTEILQCCIESNKG